MKQQLYQTMIELTNRKSISLMLKKFAQSKLSKPLIKPYTKTFKLNKDEMKYPISSYQSLHELFIRELKNNARTFSADEREIISPVDGILEKVGDISPEYEITVKGKQYSIREMVGNDEILEKYDGGTFAILYLSPSHYHRIHSPVKGKMLTRYSIGTQSYPVNAYGLKYGKAPLSKNYRTISEVSHQAGHMLVVKVGAMFINSIEITNHSDQWDKGEEVAYFSFGSTVVLLFEKNSWKPNANIDTFKHIRVGDNLGYLM